MERFRLGLAPDRRAGCAIGVSLGAFRIITAPLLFYIAAGYVIVVFQTIYANKDLSLAYDSGG